MQLRPKGHNFTLPHIHTTLLKNSFINRCIFGIVWLLLWLQLPIVFTARCTLVQSAVLPSHVVCLSVRLSVRLAVTLVDWDQIGWNASDIISPLDIPWDVCSLQTQTSWVYSKGNTRKFCPKVTHPLLIWASETFDRKLPPNGYR